MTKSRLEAFTDGVIAILITVMVLEFKVPEGETWEALRPLVPVLLTYALSFVYLGIYWNNHHHMLHAADRINGKIMWANLNLLFWLSFTPFVTGWMGEHHDAAVPAAAYGVVQLLSAIAWIILQTLLVAEHGRDSRFARALGSDTKGKLSMLMYASAVALAFVNQWMSDVLYVTVALMWLVPDRRFEIKDARST